MPIVLSSKNTLSPNTLAPASPPPLLVGASTNSNASPAALTAINLLATNATGVSVSPIKSVAPPLPPVEGVTNSIPSSVAFTATTLPAFPV